VKKLILFVLIALPCVAQEAFVKAPTVSVVMNGLDNPRGLAFGPEGALYVVEAGRGGSGPCRVQLGQTFCYGATGAVRRLWKGKVEIVASGLPSMARPVTAKMPGSRAQGPDGISFHGRGGMYVSIGWEDDPHKRADFGDVGGLFDRLIRITPDGQSETFADLGDYEIATGPPVGGESDPFNVLAEPGGELVVDAGANRLIRVAANREISTVASFPSRIDGRSTDSVPTSIVTGPDGAYYVSELTGLPFTDGAANIYRVTEGQAPEVFLSGFKTIIDIAFDSVGNLYVLEHSSGPTMLTGLGKLKRVELPGCMVDANLCPRTTLLTGLSQPTAIVVGPNDEVYMSVRGTSAGIGEVWKVEP